MGRFVVGRRQCPIDFGDVLGQVAHLLVEFLLQRAPDKWAGDHDRDPEQAAPVKPRIDHDIPQPAIRGDLDVALAGEAPVFSSRR
ncbi:MAG: hypothetical protein ACR2F6_08005 [Mycobacteriales bacterium]